MADAEKQPLSITETIDVYAGGEDLPDIEMTEEEKKKVIAFFEEQRRKAIASSEERRKKGYKKEK